MDANTATLIKKRKKKKSTTELKQKKNTIDHKQHNIESDEEEEETALPCCFFCAMKEPDPRRRRPALLSFFLEMPHRDDESHVLVMSGLWSIAMSHPDDPELPSVGAIHWMSRLLGRALDDPGWLRRHQNVYIPYYAAHVIGSYTIHSASLAALAVEAGVVAPLIELLRGQMSWVEQRVAARALGHLASYDATFPAVARHREEVVALAMRAAATCLATVHAEFLSPAARRARRKYQCDLLTRGLGGAEMEDPKAEEWASQLQCWSLYLLSCFASRDKSSHFLICRDGQFLMELSKMWGGLMNGDSPAGVGLMRILCRSDVGREAIAACGEAIERLCSLSRSSDDWQYMGIDCLIYLLKDMNTRPKVLEISAPCLVDLAELRSLGTRRNLGDRITRVLLMDFDGEKASDVVERAMRSLWELKVERRRREAAMPAEEVAERSKLAAAKQQQGNERFWAGDVQGALILYTEALQACPLKRRKKRVVLYSNRAQCQLLLREPDAAVSDATRALALSDPANRHSKSLWRRSQAYDMKGMAKESLMDCIMFVNGWLDEKAERKIVNSKVPYYAARMINKQMTASGLFAGITVRGGGEREEGNKISSIAAGVGLATIEEEMRP